MGAFTAHDRVTSDSRGLTNALPQPSSRSSSITAWMLLASPTSYCCRAFTIVERMNRSCMMSSRCSYKRRRAKISCCCRSRVRVSSSRRAPDSARRCPALSQWKPSTSQANCWCSKRAQWERSYNLRPFSRRYDLHNGSAHPLRRLDRDPTVARNRSSRPLDVVV